LSVALDIMEQSNQGEWAINEWEVSLYTRIFN
jgi:hypothetical protein